jgi:predicted outer membrane repeat protein
VYSSTFAGCFAGGSYVAAGGAIAAADKDCVINNSSFLYCEGREGKGGGACCFLNNNVNLSDSSWLNCISSDCGGAVDMFNSRYEYQLTITGCIFISNFAAVDGGALSVRNHKFNCTNCSFIQNVAVGGGGAIVSSSELILSNVVYIQNIKNGSGGCKAEFYPEMHSGGAILYNSVNNGNISIEYCIFYKNKNDNGNCSSFFFFLFIL